MSSGLAAGGQRDDGHSGQSAGGLEATQLARHAQPVHAGHLHVHEDQVVAPLPGHVQCDRAIGGDVDLQALVGQHAFEDVDVDLVVFGQQQRRHPVAVGCGDELGWHARIVGLWWFRRRQRQRDPELTARAGHAAHTDLPAHELDHASRDGQAQAGAAVVPGDAAIGLREGLEDRLQLARRDADAAVLDREVDLLRAAAGGARHGQLNATLGCELDGIAEQVGQRLFEPLAVAVDAVGHVAVQ